MKEEMNDSSSSTGVGSGEAVGIGATATPSTAGSWSGVRAAAGGECGDGGRSGGSGRGRGGSGSSSSVSVSVRPSDGSRLNPLLSGDTVARTASLPRAAGLCCPAAAAAALLDATGVAPAIGGGRILGGSLRPSTRTPSSETTAPVVWQKPSAPTVATTAAVLPASAPVLDDDLRKRLLRRGLLDDELVPRMLQAAAAPEPATV